MVQDMQGKIGQKYIFLEILAKMSIFGHLCMDANWSLFDVQKAVIPLWKALTKLFKCYFMTKVLFISQNVDYFAMVCRW